MLMVFDVDWHVDAVVVDVSLAECNLAIQAVELIGYNVVELLGIHDRLVAHPFAVLVDQRARKGLKIVCCRGLLPPRRFDHIQSQTVRRDIFRLFIWVPWVFGRSSVRQKNFFLWHPVRPKRIALRLINCRLGGAVCFLWPIQGEKRLPRQNVEFALRNNDPLGVFG
jgi:hypothetical protein